MLLSEMNDLDRKTYSVDELARKHKIDKSVIINQLKKGIKTELEHTTNREVAEEIALDHLLEDPYYYDKLLKAGL